MTHTTLNIRLLIGLVVTSVALTGGVHWLHSQQARKQATVLKEQAELAESGSPLKAAGFYRRYLVFAPQDHEARARMGLLLAGLARTPNDRFAAYLVLDQAINGIPDRDDIRRKCVELALGCGPDLAAQTREHLAALIPETENQNGVRDGTRPASRPRPTDPELGELYLLLADSYLLQANFGEAEQRLRRATEKKPDLFSAYSNRALILYQRLQREKEGDQVIEELVKSPAGQNAARAHLEAARYWGITRRDDRRRNAIDQARAIAPEDLEVQLAVARLAIERAGELAAKPDVEGSREAIEAARAILRRAAELHAGPSNTEPAVNLATLPAAERFRRLQIGDLFSLAVSVEVRAGDLVAAEKLALRGTTSAPESPEVWLSLIDVQIRRGEVDRVEDELAKLEQAGYPKQALDYHRARVMVLRGEWLPAARLLDEAIRDRDTLGELLYPARLLAGRCYEHLGELDRRFEHYQAATTVDPRDPLWLQAVERYAATLTATGQTSEAILVYEGLAARAAGAYAPLARLLIATTASKPAGEQDWRIAAQAVARIPEGVESGVLKAELAAARGHPAEARELLRAAVSRYPKELSPVLALAILAYRENALTQAAEQIAEAKQKFGDRVEIRLTEATFLPTPLTPAATATLSRLTEGTENWSTTDRRRLLQFVAGLAAAAGSPDLAVRLYDQMITATPNDLGVLLSRFDLAIRQQDEASAQATLDRIQSVDGPTGAGTRSAQASLLIWQVQRGGDRKKLIDAAEHLQAVQNQRPWWGRVILAQALVSDLNRDFATAAVKYKDAFEAGERRPETVRRLLELYYELQRYRDAEALLRQLPAQDRLLSGDELLVAELSARSGNFPRALEFAARAIPEDSTDPKRLIWLAQLRRLGGRPSEEVEKPLRRAVVVGKDQPAAWVALVQWLVGVGRKPDAESVLADAERNLTGSGKTLAVAECRDALGQVELARGSFNAAVKENPTDLPTLRAAAEFSLRANDLEQVRQLCQRILDLRNVPPDDQRFALGLLVIALPPDARHRVLELAGVLERDGMPLKLSGAESLSQLRTRVLAFAAQPDPRLRREAIGALEAIEARQSLPPNEQFLLASLHSTTGNWPAAKARLGKLIQADPRNLYYAAYYGFGLLLYETDTVEARRCLALLEKAEPNGRTTAELTARILDAEGKPAAAAEVALRLAEMDPKLLPFSAALLEELGHVERAEALYRKLATQTNPDSTLILAGFLGRQGRTAEAMATASLVADKIPAQAAGIGIVALYAGTITPDDIRTVQKWISAIPANAQTRSTILELTALLRTAEGRYPEAIQAYRELIPLRPSDSLQLNNLAYLLASHEKKFDEAFALLDQAKKSTSQWSVIRDTEAMILLEKGEATRAVDILTEVTKGSPEGVTFFHLALAHQAAKDQSGCVVAMKQAKRLRVRPANLVPGERGQLKELLKLVP